jgi:hypothetical protein
MISRRADSDLELHADVLHGYRPRAQFGEHATVCAASPYSIEAQTSADYEAARDLFMVYAERLGVDLSFQHFSDELDHLPRMYGSRGAV